MDPRLRGKYLKVSQLYSVFSEQLYLLLKSLKVVPFKAEKELLCCKERIEAPPLDLKVAAKLFILQEFKLAHFDVLFFVLKLKDFFIKPDHLNIVVKWR